MKRIFLWRPYLCNHQNSHQPLIAPPMTSITSNLIKLQLHSRSFLLPLEKRRGRRRKALFGYNSP
ncbi:hypothetical protein PanWU01x14_054530 [Parasponia andersonii]|uniref:Uncharacterized protein n=1 Tax=Parasponia andersonii TaxID=3476 RepID=A0A2P5DKU0_PARAD|nr:hypothetical protein PanWU01x14_054530 [Parasponia andersonii]